MTTKHHRSLTRLAVIGVFVIFAGITLFTTGDLGQRRRTTKKRPVAQAVGSKWKDFKHTTKAHQMECAGCHKFPSDNWKKVRAEKDAFEDITDYPKHDSCLKCHQQQFFKGRPPMVCSNCHVNPGPRDSTRWPYPNPRELFDKSPKSVGHTSEWIIQFPHDTHVDIVSQLMQGPTRFVNASYLSRADDKEASCKVCHQTMAPQGKSPDEFLIKPPANIGDNFWLKKSTFKSQPIGHTVCFTCHTQDSGLSVVPQKCDSCHKPRPTLPAVDFDPALPKQMGVTDKPMLDAWATRHSSGKFPHEQGGHADLECATCHTVAKMNTADWASMKVPIANCAMCHVTPSTADGGALNYEADKRKADPKFQCTKCHVTFGKQPMPQSHADALAAGK